jgi:hypothetical protein
VTLPARRLPAAFAAPLDPPPERRCTFPRCSGWTSTAAPDGGRCSSHVGKALPSQPPGPDAFVWWVWRGVGAPDAGPLTWAELVALRP